MTWSSLREERFFLPLFVILMVATAMPIWAGRYLPLLDLPNHLSAITIWHAIDDTKLDFAQYYRLNLVPVPYWIYYYSVHLIAYLCDVETANKLFLTGYAVLLPTGTLAIALRFQRSPWLSLFAFPLVWNFNLAEGFIAFATGAALLPWAVVALDRHAERPSVLRGAIATVAGAGMYFSHLIPYLVFLSFAAAIVILNAPPFSVRRFATQTVPALLVAAGGFVAYWYSNSMRFHGLRNTGSREFIWRTMDEKLAALSPRLLNFLSSDVDDLVVVVLAVSWIALALVTRSDVEEPRRSRDYVVEGCALLAFLAYLALPRSMNRPFYWFMIDGRVVVVIALFAPLVIRRQIRGAHRLWLVPVVLSVLLYDVALFSAFARFNRVAAGFDEIVGKIPLHRRTITLVLRPLSEPEFNVNVYNQWPSYTQVRRGGYNFYNFKEGFPLKYKVTLPAPMWDHAEYFNFDTHGQAWDYYLTHNEGAWPNLRKHVASGKVRLVAESGPWRVWERIGEPATGGDPVEDRNVSPRPERLPPRPSEFLQQKSEPHKI